MKTSLLFAFSLVLMLPHGALAAPPDYLRSKFDPIHFPPLIEKATDAQCLKCHQEVLEPTVREKSPAGLRADDVQALYQNLSTYEGTQETFHRRHLETAYAKSVMNMRCTTCHQGNEPRDEMLGTPPINDNGSTLRKMVDPNLCLQCHGQMNFSVMGLPGPWKGSKVAFANNCLICHAGIRTTRHQVSYLKPEAIEKLAQEKGSDVCFGCHGGRAWYRSVPLYPRHAWPGMAPETPEWAKNRPTDSPERFKTGTK